MIFEEKKTRRKKNHSHASLPSKEDKAIPNA